MPVSEMIRKYPHRYSGRQRDMRAVVHTTRLKSRVMLILLKCEFGGWYRAGKNHPVAVSESVEEWFEPRYKAGALFQKPD